VSGSAEVGPLHASDGASGAPITSPRVDGPTSWDLPAPRSRIAARTITIITVIVVVFAGLIAWVMYLFPIDSLR
jgi:hypothetical protein